MSQLVFKNYGGSYQLKIQDAQDLEKVLDLDEAHWAATSIPIHSLNCDHVFTSFLDADQNDRIRTDEVKAAITWLFRFHVNSSRFSEYSDVLKLCDINSSHPEGQKIRSAAELILTNINSPDAQNISLAQVRDEQSIMASAANNGDGIISPDATSDSDLAQFITSVMQTVGSVLDASGKPGISQEQLDAFFNEAASYLAWKEAGEITKGSAKESGPTKVMPWGIETPEAFGYITILEEKIEQYFAQCVMVKFDERALDQMKLRQKEMEELDFTDTSIMVDRVKDAPLAVPNPEGVLDLNAMINPLYAESLSDLHEKVLKRALENPVKQIARKQWDMVKNIFAAYRQWLKDEQGTKVRQLSVDRLRDYLNGSYKERVSGLIANDLTVADDLNQIHNLEKLILYQRWLLELANNFVCFSSLYDPQRRAFFEMGTLVIDGKQVTLTMKVRDRKAHRKIAENSHMYLLYVEVTGRQDKDIKFEIVAVFTSGTTGSLRIGKRGIFFSIDGKEWDAEIVDVVKNPISIRESIVAPFQQFAGFIKKQIDKFTKSGESSLEASLTAPSASTATRDLLLGGGIAFAALGSSFAYVTQALSQVKLSHILLALLGVLTVVFVPGMVLGFLKTRKRDMSVLLEALGWAVNVRMRLNNTIGKLFTHSPPLPKGALIERKDVVVQFVKNFGYTSQRSRTLVILSLIVIVIVVSSILILLNFPEIKSFAARNLPFLNNF